jgi:hypothetical protein
MFPGKERAEELTAPIQNFLALLPKVNRNHVAASLPVFPKKYRSKLGDEVHRASVLACAAGSSLGWNLPVLHCTDVNDKRVRLVWKSIDSLGRLGLILRAAPEARAVVILRHPCASIASIVRGTAQGKFASAVPPSEDYGIMKMLCDTNGGRRRKFSLNHLRSMHPVERMTWIWILVNEKAFDDTRGMTRVTSVRYEDLCHSPVEKARELFSFSGLQWSDQTEKFINRSTLGTGPKGIDRLTQNSERYYGVFRNPTRAAHKWKSEMKSEDIDRVYRVLRESGLLDFYPDSEFVPAYSSA